LRFTRFRNEATADNDVTRIPVASSKLTCIEHVYTASMDKVPLIVVRPKIYGTITWYGRSQLIASQNDQTTVP